MGCDVHLKILGRLPKVELVALADSDPRRLAEAHRRVPSAAAVVDYPDLLAISEVEAVVICLPNALHAEAAVAALEAGKHVYLEKPIASRLEDARQILEAWRSAGTVGMVGFNYRFNPLYQSLRRHIQSGRIGVPVGVRTAFSMPARESPAWMRSRESGGGALLDLASHHTDLVRFFFGDSISEVWAKVWSARTEDDSASLHMRLSSGILVQSFFSTSAVDEDRFEVYGPAGKLTVDRYRSLHVEVDGPVAGFSIPNRFGRMCRSVLHSPYMFKKILSPGNEPSYRAALKRFVVAARTGCPPHPDFEDGYRSLMAIEAAEESARTGRAVSLAEFAEMLLSEEEDGRLC